MVVSANRSEGSRKVATTSPSPQVQFDNTKFQQAAFFAGFLLREQQLGVARQFEKLHALVHVGVVGLLVLFDLALAAILLLAPLVSTFSRRKSCRRGSRACRQRKKKRSEEH